MHYVDIVRWSNTIFIYLSKWRFNVLIKTVFLEMFITVNWEFSVTANIDVKE